METDSNSKKNIFFDKLKPSFKTNDGSWQNTCKIIAAFIFVIIIGLAFIALPVTEIVIGSLNINQCPVDPRIPIYLIITGIAVLILCFSSIALILYDKNKGWFLIIFNILVVLFLLAWFITGFVWTYNAADRVQFFYKDTSTYCDYSTFRCAYIFRFINFGFILGILKSCTSSK